MPFAIAAPDTLTSQDGRKPIGVNKIEITMDPYKHGDDSDFIDEIEET